MDATFGVGNLVVTPINASNNQSFAISFAAQLANADLPLLVLKTGDANGAAVPGSVTTVSDGAGNTVQTVTPAITSGTLGFKFNGSPARRCLRDQRVATADDRRRAAFGSTFRLTLNGVPTRRLRSAPTRRSRRTTLTPSSKAAFPSAVVANGSLFTVAADLTDLHKFTITATNELSSTNLPLLGFVGVSVNGSPKSIGSLSTNFDGIGNEVQSLALSGNISGTTYLADPGQRDRPEHSQLCPGH